MMRKIGFRQFFKIAYCWLTGPDCSLPSITTQCNDIYWTTGLLNQWIKYNTFSYIYFAWNMRWSFATLTNIEHFHSFLIINKSNAAMWGNLCQYISYFIQICIKIYFQYKRRSLGRRLGLQEHWRPGRHQGEVRQVRWILIVIRLTIRINPETILHYR